MAQVDLNRNKDALLQAHREIFDSNSSTDWVVFGYEGQTNVLKVVEKGDGGVEEMVDELNSGKIMYASCRLLDPNTNLPKFVFINWQGEGAPDIRKGACVNHIRPITDLFKGHHVTINARTEEDVDEDLLKEKISKASGSYSFHKEKPKPSTADPGPVGTNYKRIIPQAEIRPSQREQFWEKVQEEQKMMKAEDVKKTAEERDKMDQERRDREKREASERDKKEVERMKKISEIKEAERKASAPTKKGNRNSWEEQQVDALKDAEERSKRSEMMRKQRAAEAQSLASKRTKNMKDMFEQKPQSQFDKPTAPPPPRKLKHAFNPAGDAEDLQPKRKEPIALPSEPEKAPTPPEPRSPVRQAVEEEWSREAEPQPEPEVPQMPVRQLPKVPEPEPEPEYEPEPVREPVAPQPVAPDAQVPAEQPGARNLLKQGLPPRQDSDEEEDDQNWDERARRQAPVDDQSDDEATPTPVIPQSQQPEPVISQPPAEQAYTEQAYTPEEESYPEYDDVTITPEMGLCARALYDYQAAEENEISFDPGEILTNIDPIDEGWWVGMATNGRQGMFPANYVELLNG